MRTSAPNEIGKSTAVSSLARLRTRFSHVVPNVFDAASSTFTVSSTGPGLHTALTGCASEYLYLNVWIREDGTALTNLQFCNPQQRFFYASLGSARNAPSRAILATLFLPQSLAWPTNSVEHRNPDGFCCLQPTLLTGMRHQFSDAFLPHSPQY